MCILTVKERAFVEMKPSRHTKEGFQSVFKEIEIVLHFCNVFVNDKRDGKNCVQHYHNHANKSRQTSRKIITFVNVTSIFDDNFAERINKQYEINPSSSVNYIYSTDA